MIRIFFLFIVLIAVGCSDKNEQVNDGYLVVTTTGMLGDAVKNIVGNEVEVISLMGPGVDPHLYKATQGDLARLNKADVIYYNGLFLEGKMGDVFEKLARVKPVVAIGESLPESKIRRDSTFQEAFDPHVWFDISLWSEVVGLMNEDLGKRFPELKSTFDSNTRAFQSSLDSLHKITIREISTIPEENRVLITSHDAFGYFGRAYNIEVRGLQGLSTATEFGLRDITTLVDFIIERKIKAVFVETSVSEKAINAVVQGCNERGWKVVIGGTLYGDAMGADNTPEGTYVGMVHSNVSQIVSALTDLGDSL